MAAEVLPIREERNGFRRRREEFMDEAERRGLEPIRVMFDAMEHFVRRAKNARKSVDRDAAMLQAVEVAKHAAPYCHAKVAQQVELSGPDGGPMEMVGLMAHLTNEELAERARLLRDRRPDLKLIEGKVDERA